MADCRIMLNELLNDVIEEMDNISKKYYHNKPENERRGFDVGVVWGAIMVTNKIFTPRRCSELMTLGSDISQNIRDKCEGILEDAEIEFYDELMRG